MFGTLISPGQESEQGPTAARSRGGDGLGHEDRRSGQFD